MTKKETLRQDIQRTSYLWYVVVLQGDVEVGPLLFSGLLCTIAHLACQHRRTGARKLQCAGNGGF